MSYILDALRKSQQTRQPAAGAASRGAVHNISASMPVGGWWLILGIALLAGISIAAFLFWRGTLSALPDPPANPETSDATMESLKPAEVASAVPVKESAPVEAPVKKSIPVSDLAEQARIPVAAPPKKAAAVKAEKKPAAPRKPAAPVKTVTPAEATFPVADETPLLQQMPAEFQQALPPLAMTIHVYSHEESQRILFINNREYRRGSLVEGGVKVEDIVPDGVVLSFRGERFKLRRPR